MIVDHLRAVTDHAYRAKTQRRIAAFMGVPGRLRLLKVLHEADGSCCKLESWPMTAAHVVSPAIAAASGADAHNVKAMMQEHEPAIILAGRAAS